MIVIDKFEYKYNQKYGTMKPNLTNFNNGTLFFENQIENFVDISKIVVNIKSDDLIDLIRN